MSDLEAIERAIWEAERDWHCQEVMKLHFAPPTEMRLRLLSPEVWQWRGPDPADYTLFGMRILLDPSMRPDEIKLVADCSCVVKLINLD